MEHRVRYAEFLIEALLDRLEIMAQSSDETIEGLKEIIAVIGAARPRIPKSSQSGKALLNFYEARAKQELRSEEHTSELQSLMRISYAVFCLKKKTTQTTNKKPK